MSYLHVLEINPLPVVLLAIIFSLWRKKWQPTPVFLPGESHGERGLAGYSPWVCKELDMIEVTFHTLTSNFHRPEETKRNHDKMKCAVLDLGGRSSRSRCDLYQRVFCLCFPLRVLLFLILHLGL